MKLIKLDDEQYLTADKLCAIFYNTKDLTTVVIPVGMAGIACKDSPQQIAERATLLGIKLVQVGERQWLNVKHLIALGIAKPSGKGKIVVAGIGALEAGFSLNNIKERLEQLDS